MCGQPPVDRRGDQARLVAGEQQLHIGGAVLVEDGDPIANLESEHSRKAAGELRTAFVELAISLASALVPDRFEVRMASRAPTDQFGDRPHGRCCPPGTALSAVFRYFRLFMIFSSETAARSCSISPPSVRRHRCERRNRGGSFRGAAAWHGSSMSRRPCSPQMIDDDPGSDRDLARLELCEHEAIAGQFGDLDQVGRGATGGIEGSTAATVSLNSTTTVVVEAAAGALSDDVVIFCELVVADGLPRHIRRLSAFQLCLRFSISLGS